MADIRDTQLTTDFINYDTKNLRYAEPYVGTIGSKTAPITFRRISISTKNPDGTVGDFLIPLSGFSFGVSRNMDFNTGLPNGYNLPVCLHTRGNPTENEIKWVKSFENVVESIKRHVFSIRKEIKKYDLEISDMKNMSPISYKKVEGVIDPTVSPALFIKFMMATDKEKDKTEKMSDEERKAKELSLIKTKFYNENNELINPLDHIGKYANVVAVLKIDNIFIGNKISLQIKLYEAQLNLVSSGVKSFISQITAPKSVIHSAVKDVTNKVKVEEPLEDDDNGSIVDDEPDEDEEPVEEEPVEEEPKPKKVKKVKKVVKRVKKSTV